MALQAAVEFVLFDLYGTLLDIEVNEGDPTVWRALADELQRRGIKAEGPQLRETFCAALHDERSRLPDGFVLDNVFRRFATALQANDLDAKELAAAFRAHSTQKLSLRPYASRLLEALRASGCKTGIVSNTEGILTRFDLSKFPVLERVDATVLSSDLGVRKPDRRIFETAMLRMGVTAETGVFVGDSLTEDIVGARQVGLRCIHVAGNSMASEGMAGVIGATPDLHSIAKALNYWGWTGAVSQETGFRPPSTRSG